MIVAWVLAMLLVAAPPSAPAAAEPDPPDTIPVATDPSGSRLDETFLESERFDDCVGLVQRPNCGSTNKGDWRQGAVLAVLIAGLGAVGWRIVRAVRR